MAAAAASGLGNPPQPAREEEEEGMLGSSLSPAAAAEEGLSDAETASSSSTTAAGGAPNSSLSSGSSTSGRSLARCSSCLSRLSLDCSPAPSPSPAAASRPHRSSDPAWAAIRAASLKSPLGPSDFKLVRRVGGGDIGTVYLCRLLLPHGGTSSPCMYAMKVVDRRRVAGKKKPERERRILRRLDHPFLPTLFADFDAAPHLSCAVTEFCPGGDLHSLLRQRQPHRRFSEAAVRFYVAEVVAALEYIHMMDIVYRDLKPENVLVRADGHIMLTDFDLSLKCDPTAPTPAHVISDQALSFSSGAGHSSSSSSCILPSCIVPSVSCFTLFPNRHRNRNTTKKTITTSSAFSNNNKSKSSSFPTGALDLEFVAEPVDLRSMSFVGTHEYLAPEIVSGEGHGSSVDWWTLGIFVYELLYGVTPFKGHDNEMTLANIVARALEFPGNKDREAPSVSSAAKDLVAGLLAKDPGRRLGATVGAAAIKRHPFFNGVNWALLRCATPPYVPPPFVVGAAARRKDGGGGGLGVAGAGEDLSEDDGDDSSCPGTPVEYY